MRVSRMRPSVFGGGRAVHGEIAVRKMVLPRSPCAWRGSWRGDWRKLRDASADLWVRFGGWARCARFGLRDHARFSCGALPAKALGTLMGAVLLRLAVERRGWGCGVGTAVGNHAPL